MTMKKIHASFVIANFLSLRRMNNANDGVGVMVFNATFNNISVISWHRILLVEETGLPRENHRPVASH
jgi:hypothetical protein